MAFQFPTLGLQLSRNIRDCRLPRQSPSPIRQDIIPDADCQRCCIVDNLSGFAFLGLPHGQQFHVADLIEGGPQGSPGRVILFRNSDFPKVRELPRRIGQLLRSPIEKHHPHGRRIPPSGKRLLPFFVGNRHRHPPAERGLCRPHARQSSAHSVETHGNQEMASLCSVSVGQTAFSCLGSIPNIGHSE